MQTSCPACRTTFRVTQAQLGMRRGLVRCGQCNAVFNAYDTLLPELDAVVCEPQPGPAAERWHAAEPKGVDEVLAEAGPGGGLLAHQALGAASAPAAVMPAPLSSRSMGRPKIDLAPTGGGSGAFSEPGAQLSSRSMGRPKIDLAPTGGGSGAFTEPGAQLTPSADTLESMPAVHGGTPATPDAAPRVHDAAAAILLSDLPHRLPAPPVPVWKTALYGLLSLSLLILLLAQLAFFLRAELAAALPASRPWLEALCRPLDCAVPLPRALTQGAIVSSSLEHHPEQPARVQLAVLLANRSAQAQAWPHLVLTLSDVREAPVAQKAFAPHIYLPAGTPVAQGFPPMSEQEIRLRLDLGQLDAAGYALGLVYPE